MQYLDETIIYKRKQPNRTMKIILIILLIITIIAAVSAVIEVHKIETDYVELTRNKDDDTEK